MSEPNAELSRIYGNSKEASAELAARIAKAMLGFSVMRGDQSHVEGAHDQEALDEEIARAVEAERMSSMINAMKTAQVIGKFMARAEELPSLEKDAFIGKLLTETLPLAAGKVVGKIPGAQAVSRGLGTLKPGWKGKALATGGALGLTYGGYKGLSAARDYANKEPSNQAWGKNRPLTHNVSEWGYPSS